MTLSRSLLLSGAILICAGSAFAGKEITDIEIDSVTGSRVEITSVFDPPPPTGYLPVRVVALNGAAKETAWSVNFSCGTQFMNNSHRHSSEFAFTVAPKARQTQMLLVPVSVAYGERDMAPGL